MAHYSTFRWITAGASLAYYYGIETQVEVRQVRKRRLIAFGIAALVLYGAGFAGFSFAMHQPPDTFARLMKHVGPAPMLLFPFESMWKSARAGHLNAGDEAPDFTLPRLDGSGEVKLSSLRGIRPVVLIFGSYT